MSIARRIDLRLEGAPGWSAWQSPAGRCAWWSGHAFLEGQLIEGSTAAAAIAEKLAPTAAEKDIADFLLRLDGHFALAIQDSTGNLLVATDRVRSIPLLLGHDNDKVVIGMSFNWVRAALGGRCDDPSGRLELAMAGYTLRDATIDRRIRVLLPGEWAKVPNTGPLERSRWHRYQPWKAGFAVDAPSWHRQFLRVTDDLFAKVVRSLNGRTVMLPLSGGFDSRLVASALHRHGHRAVRCYSYGRRGNFEATAARSVAERLGYPWEFIEYTHASVRSALYGREFEEYRSACDTGAAIPFFQDFAAIAELRRRGSLPPDAVFINGNSGDFISGNHVPLPIFDMPPSANCETRGTLLKQLFLKKHFSLWRDLRSPENLRILTTRLEELLADEVPSNLPPGYEYAAWEIIEFEARQSKFVINGQRVYEHFGHTWRLPLWDNDYLAFWETVPAQLKRAQKLYRDSLFDADWGGVWRSIPINPVRRWHLPFWAKMLRMCLMAACLPFGTITWKAVDKRIFGYWLDVLGISAQATYLETLLDRRGARSAISFRCQHYLDMHDRIAVESS